MVDSGSSDTFIDDAKTEELDLVVFPKKGTIPLADKKHVAEIIGEVIIDIEVNGVKHEKVPVQVIKNLCTDIIIGRDVLKEHSRVVLNFNGPREELVIGAIPSEHSTSLSSPPSAPSTSTTQSIAQTFCARNIPPPPLFTHLTADIKPVATKSRRQSPAELSFMRQEVAKLSSQGVIRPSVSPWRAQPFVTKDDGTHKRRMVIDYSDTINRFTELDAYPMPNVLEMVEKISQYKYFATFDLKSAYHQIPIQDKDC